MQRNTAWLLFAWALVATVALAWVVGRQSVPAPTATVAHPPPIAAASDSPAPTNSAPSEQVPTAYPQYVSTIPEAFRGSWDEMIADKCYARETRFTFGKRTFANFEVQWEVTKVKLYSPTEMDLYLTTKDENASQVDDVLEFKLVDGGETLTGRRPGSDFFKRCPAADDSATAPSSPPG
jgi:hypothetical protein